jgi:hypothetical protein
METNNTKQLRKYKTKKNKTLLLNEMKPFVVVNVHSCIDVITNSSTELFVVNNSTVEAVKETLAFMLQHWNEMAIKGVFGPCWQANKRTGLGTKIKQKEPCSFENMFGDVFIFTENIYKDRKNDGYSWAKRENIGKVIIIGGSDNSIPYEIMEWIETAFGNYSNVTRHHLG